MTYRLLVTGTRVSRQDAEHWFQYMINIYGEPILWIFGDAKGVDTQCRQFCERSTRPYHQFDADWDTWPNNAGNVRNSVMVDFCKETPNSKCLGLPIPTSRGTFDCIKKAERAKFEVIVR